MHQRLAKSKPFAGKLSSGCDGYSRRCNQFCSSAPSGKNLIAGLQHAFQEVEAEFLNIAGREGLRDGTTAVVALVQAS
ncbi:MAG: hypothetical protein SGPRY_007236 [Prymnesium sp.]